MASWRRWTAAPARSSGRRKLPYPIAFGSGTTATAGDLLFHGEPDGNFQAYDAKTGDVAWQFQTGNAATAPAVTYQIDGKQYVAIAATNKVWSLRAGRYAGRRG